MIGTRDNFEYWENIYSDGIRDMEKFRSITMALWIQKVWHIFEKDLKQKMWNPKSDVLMLRKLIRQTIGLDI